MDAKNRLLREASGDQDRTTQVEAAYEVLFMNKLRSRVLGESVPETVKYADVPPPKDPKVEVQKLMAKIPGGGVSVSTLKTVDSSLQLANVLFGVLTLSVLTSGFTNPPGMDQPPALQIALAFAASIYLQNNRKGNGLPRAAVLTLATFVAGALLGTGLEAWLRVDLIPIGSFSSPSCLVSFIALVAMWAGTVFLI
ncbi:unnamed protein product [Pedinophyceae sp. YPF-701]|nr:unnamed protein product [Pedinophyceae sp. YPF-701]